MTASLSHLYIQHVLPFAFTELLIHSMFGSNGNVLTMSVVLSFNILINSYFIVYFNFNIQNNNFGCITTELYPLQL